MKVFLGIVLGIALSIAVYFIFVNQNNSINITNRLVNTEWKGKTYHGHNCLINFGKTSFSVNVDNRNLTGSYEINGDTVSFILGKSLTITGSLIGDTLTVGGTWDISGKFKQSK